MAWSDGDAHLELEDTNTELRHTNAFSTAERDQLRDHNSAQQ
ncbi:hypothetical protein AB0H42_32095 [Nocardia sp. NPDC050799]